MRIHFIPLLCGLTVFGSSYSQDFCWPTDASQVMTSSFGEYRSNHLHAGLDFTTHRQEGWKVFAIRDGFVKEISVSPYGYGRLLFFELDNGITARFAHLSRFAEPIESYVKAEQKRLGRFTVDLKPDPEAFRFSMGDVVAYTGSTGAGGPHLHFEMLDPKGRSLNPFLLGMAVTDSIKPFIQEIAVSPLSFGSHVNGDFQPRRFRPRALSKGRYQISEIISCWGRIGFSVEAFDMAEGSGSRFGVYEIGLDIDGKRVFSTRYDAFQTEMTRQVNIDRDYRLKQWNWGLFQKCYKPEGNSLDFYDPDEPGAGMITCWREGETSPHAHSAGFESDIEGSFAIEPGEHAFAIETADYFGNRSTVSGRLRMVPILNRVSAKILSSSTDRSSQSDETRFPLSIEHHLFDDYIRFSVRSENPFLDVPTLTVELGQWNRMDLPLFSRTNREYVGELPLVQFDGAVRAKAVYNHAGKWISAKDEFNLVLITPETGGELTSSDGLCRIVFPPGSVFRSLYAGLETKTCSSAVQGTAYSVYPEDVPLGGRIQVEMDVSDAPFDASKLSVYSVSDRGKRFLGNGWNGKLTAESPILGSFAAAVDTTEPVVFGIKPTFGQRTSQRSPKISFRLSDAGSGIGEETDYTANLDGTPLILELIPERNLCIADVDDPLQPGKHELDIEVRDRSGNTVRKNSVFYVGSR